MAVFPFKVAGKLETLVIVRFRQSAIVKEAELRKKSKSPIEGEIASVGPRRWRVLGKADDRANGKVAKSALGLSPDEIEAKAV